MHTHAPTHASMRVCARVRLPARLASTRCDSLRRGACLRTGRRIHHTGTTRPHAACAWVRRKTPTAAPARDFGNTHAADRRSDAAQSAGGGCKRSSAQRTTRELIQHAAKAHHDTRDPLPSGSTDTCARAGRHRRALTRAPPPPARTCSAPPPSEPVHTPAARYNL